MYFDPTGEIAANVVGAVIGGIIGLVGGIFLSKWLADKIGLKGWKRTIFIAGLSVIITAAAATIGYFIAPYLGSKAKTIIQGLRGIGKTSCFVAGTAILAKDGYIPIEQIQAGDYVYAEDTDTYEKAFKKVLRTFESETSRLVHVCVNGERIITTPEHPFYVVNNGWIEASRLKEGDVLILANGQSTSVDKIICEQLPAPIVVYNFEVDEFHTYYVGESSVLVHNTCIKDFLKSPKKFKDIEKLLKQYGFERVRQSGSHVIFKDLATGKIISVPNHGSKSIAIGTLRSILKLAGLL